MKNVPQTPQRPVAFYASLIVGADEVEGIALRDPQDRVYFQTSATGLWTELFDADRWRLMMYGDQAISDVQAILDGDLYKAVARRNSHTLKAA